MLASIHPLGERARGQRYSVTVAAYALGSVVGATALGTALGALGQVVLGNGSGAARLMIGALAAVTAAVLDGSRRPIPSWHRQVNEDWLARYRGWVYGFGFGAQLGLGVITIVTTASVYLMWIAAALAGSPLVGALIGAAFGLARAAPILIGERASSAGAIAARVRRWHDWNGRFRVVTVLVESATALVVVAVAVS